MTSRSQNYLIAVGLLALLGCSGANTTGGPSGAGGALNSGSGGQGAGGTIVTGGATAAGGSLTTGGTPGVGGSQAVGGTLNSGGSNATGGALAVGGSLSTGGSLATGGSKSTGGASNTGGTKAVGGATSAGGNTTSGGTTSTGGSKATGGTVASGGSKSTGGVANTGGIKATGGTSANTGGTKATGGSATSGTGGAVTTCSTNELSTCTFTSGLVYNSSIPYGIECHFGGNPGNYLVTVELGGAAAGDTIIEAEMRRRMLAETTTAAGQTQVISFVTNVRQPEGQPTEPNVPTGTPGLDVYFGGTAPTVTAICHQLMAQPVVIYVAGDSTVCDQASAGYDGWGQYLPQHFVSPATIANYADSGESSGSFLNSGGLWGAIKSHWVAGDWVLVEFGHNDKTTTEADFRTNMTAYVTQARAAGVNPVYLTPISRATGSTCDITTQHVNSVGVNLPAVIKDLGATLNVPVIDLTTTTCNWLNSVGVSKAVAGYFANGSDTTHLGAAGADVVSGFVRDGIKTSPGVPGLAKYLRD